MDSFGTNRSHLPDINVSRGLKVLGLEFGTCLTQIKSADHQFHENNNPEDRFIHRAWVTQDSLQAFG